MICVGIALVAAGIIFLIRATEPKAEKSSNMRKSAALVETVVAERGTFRPVIVALGTVEPAREIDLGPRIGGEVVSMAENFLPGGFVSEGELLLEIDPADYENTLAMRQSDLEQAQAELEQEEGQQDAAKQEFALLGEEIDPASRALVLREPQIRSAKARVDSARAMLEMASLDLERTKIRAPFDAQILTRNVNLGSQVSPGVPLARLVGIETYWVVASVPQNDLQWIQLPGGDTAGASVDVAKPGIWRDGQLRHGEVARLVGALDDETRLARLLITVEDPLARETEAPPLLLGTVVEARIKGRELRDVVRLKREYLHKGNTVWVYDEGKLAIRTASIVFQDVDYAYLSSGVEAGEQVIATGLATVAEGILLRSSNEPSENTSAE